MSKVTGMVVAESVSGLMGGTLGSSPSYLSGPMPQSAHSLMPCPKCGCTSVLSRPGGLLDTELPHYTLHLKPINGTPATNTAPLFATYADFVNLGQGVPVFRCIDCGFAYNAEGVFHPGDCEGYTINPVDGLGDPLGAAADTQQEATLCPVQLCPITDALHLMSIQTQYEANRVQLCMATAYMLWLENEVERLRKKHGDGTGAPLPKESPYTEGLYMINQPNDPAAAVSTEDDLVVATMMLSSVSKQLYPNHVLHPQAEKHAANSLLQLFNEKGPPAGFNNVQIIKNHHGADTVHMLVNFPGHAPSDFSFKATWVLPPAKVVGVLLQKAHTLLDALKQNQWGPTMGTVSSMETALYNALAQSPGITGASVKWAEGAPNPKAMLKYNNVVIAFHLEGELDGNPDKLFVAVSVTNGKALMEPESAWLDWSVDPYGGTAATEAQTFLPTLAPSFVSSAGEAMAAQHLNAGGVSGGIKWHTKLGDTLNVTSLMPEQNYLVEVSPLTAEKIGKWSGFYSVVPHSVGFGAHAMDLVSKRLNHMGYAIALNTQKNALEQLDKLVGVWEGLVSMEVGNVVPRAGYYRVPLRLKLEGATHVKTLFLRVYRTSMDKTTVAQGIVSTVGPLLINHTSTQAQNHFKLLLAEDIEQSLHDKLKTWSVQGVSVVDGYPSLNKNSNTHDTQLAVAFHLRLIDTYTGKAMVALMKGTYPVQKILESA